VTKGLPVRTRRARARGPGSTPWRARRAVLLAPGGGPWPPVRRVRPWFSRDKISFSGRAGQNPAQSVSRCRWEAVASGCHRSSLHSLPLTQPLVLPSARPAPPALDPRPPQPADDEWDRVGFFGHAGHWGAEYAETDGGAGRRSRGRRSRRCTLVSRRRCARPASIAK